jgi:RNA polymerase sigma factor (sigma-70 family)
MWLVHARRKVAMRTHRPVVRAVEAEAERRLIANAKEFLKQCFEGRAPDAFLTHEWETFYRVYSRFVRRLAAKYRLDTHEREDLVQEVWRRVHRHLPEVNSPDQPSGLRAWLFTLVRNTALTLIRWKLRHPVRLFPNLSVPIDRESTGGAKMWEQSCDTELLEIVIAESKKELSVENHRLLTMRLLHGCSLSEAAAGLNLSKQQVKARQKRLFRRIRGQLALYRGVPLHRIAAPHLSPKRVF